MAAPVDQTVELLEKLEAELAEKQATVDARLAREKAQLDELTTQEADFTGRQRAADLEFEALVPRRDGLVLQRDALLQTGSRGNRVRATLWSTAAIALTLGVVVPLGAHRNGDLLFPSLGLAVAASLVTGLATHFSMRRKK